MSNNSNTTDDDHNSEDIVKKESRWLGDDTNFGKVHEILGEYIITQKGNVTKYGFYIPDSLAERFDGNTILTNQISHILDISKMLIFKHN